MILEEINVEAAKTAITAFVGTQGLEYIRQLYAMLDNAERRGFDSGVEETTITMQGASKDDYTSGWSDGHAAGYSQGLNASTAAAPQPEVLMPDTDQDGRVTGQPTGWVDGMLANDECKYPQCVRPVPIDWSIYTIPAEALKTIK